MDLNITQLSDKEIATVCIKYNIIQANELKNYTRDHVVSEINKWCRYKKQIYRQRRNSAPNITTPQVNTERTIQSTQGGGLKRTYSAPMNINKMGQSPNSPPKSTIQYQRNRRMSEPFTEQEKHIAKEDHKAKQVYNSGQTELKQTFQDPNMEKYDQIGIYPKRSRLIAMGDLHGDLRVTN